MSVIFICKNEGPKITSNKNAFPTIYLSISTRDCGSLDFNMIMVSHDSESGWRELFALTFALTDALLDAVS